MIGLLLRGAAAAIKAARSPTVRKAVVDAAKKVGAKAKQLTSKVVQECRHIKNRNLSNIPSGLKKPVVSDKGLQSKLDKLYREEARIGSGSTADAVRFERLTGKPVGQRWHTQKAGDSVRELQRWLRNNPNASPADKSAANAVIRDMQNALVGK